jgi:tetratricopeptide (TPR) repeat protein
MALAQLSQKEHGEAQYTLEQLMASTPDTAALHHMMAMAAGGSGDTERAEQELRRALELDENYVPSRIALARIALANGQIDELDQHLARLQSQAPQNPDVLLLQAASASRGGDSRRAVKLAEQAFTLAPRTPTLLALGSYKEAGGDPEGALQLYRSWIDENPEDIVVRMTIANSLQTMQKAGEANIYYEQVLQIDPDNAVALNNLAWQIREEDPDKALEYAMHASRIAPDSADVLDTLAVIEYINKDYKQAGRSIERALRQSPDHPSLLYHSAMISAATGDSAQAIDILDDLLAEDTDFPEIEQANGLLLELRK